MLHHHYKEAVSTEDDRFIVLDDLHSRNPVPAAVATALGQRYGVSMKDTVREMLVKLGAQHSSYLPER